MAAELGRHGRAIWDAYGAAQLDASGQALVRELARCADTLDRLDDLATGRQERWALLVFDDMGEVHLSVDKILDEQRKTQVTFKTLHAEIRQAGIRPQGRKADEGETDDPGDMLAELRKRKAERESQSG